MPPEEEANEFGIGCEVGTGVLSVTALAQDFVECVDVRLVQTYRLSLQWSPALGVPGMADTCAAVLPCVGSFRLTLYSLRSVGSRDSEGVPIFRKGQTL